MSRPTVYKKGAMTDAERQRRRRKRLKREAKEVERLAVVEANHEKHARNRVNPIKQWRHAAINAQLQISVLEARLRLYEQVPLHDVSGAADELARQIAEYMQEKPGMAIDDVRAAIDRRFGTKP
jgi:3'-phosphoadenosine 5'-phosphosulfate sulfotransferase (PAPS reductase)/FAD synthetase